MAGRTGWRKGNRIGTDGEVARIWMRRRDGSEVCAIIDAADVDMVRTYTWYARWDPNVRSFYAVTHLPRVGGRQPTVSLHRLLLVPTAGSQVDHESHDTLDNRRMNLRVATRAQNQQNRTSRAGASAYKGVGRYRGSWQAHIRVDGKKRHIGQFHSEEEAALAYDAAARRYFGKFAYLNFPPS